MGPFLVRAEAAGAVVGGEEAEEDCQHRAASRAWGGTAQGPRDCKSQGVVRDGTHADWAWPENKPRQA